MLLIPLVHHPVHHPVHPHPVHHHPVHHLVHHPLVQQLVLHHQVHHLLVHLQTQNLTKLKVIQPIPKVQALLHQVNQILKMMLAVLLMVISPKLNNQFHNNNKLVFFQIIHQLILTITVITIIAQTKPMKMAKAITVNI